MPSVTGCNALSAFAAQSLAIWRIHWLWLDFGAVHFARLRKAGRRAEMAQRACKGASGPSSARCTENLTKSVRRRGGVLANEGRKSAREGPWGAPQLLRLAVALKIGVRCGERLGASEGLTGALRKWNRKDNDNQPFYFWLIWFKTVSWIISMSSRVKPSNSRRG